MYENLTGECMDCYSKHLQSDSWRAAMRADIKTIVIVLLGGAALFLLCKGYLLVKGMAGW